MATKLAVTNRISTTRVSAARGRAAPSVTAEDQGRPATPEATAAAQPPAVDDAAKDFESISLAALIDYQRDVWERTILFWDALRQRGDDALEHERLGLPPPLDFTSETILDARGFAPRPTNYALLRITSTGQLQSEECVDPDKPPVIIIDPRAGHGPGIGGFRHESEVGMALAEGYPVYFVIFFPEPDREQTLPTSITLCAASSRRWLRATLGRHRCSTATARRDGR